MRHTIDPLTDVMEHFSRQSRRIALCVGLGLLLILGSLGSGSYLLWDLNTRIKEGRQELKELKGQRRILQDEIGIAQNELWALQSQIADVPALVESIGTNPEYKQALQSLPEQQRVALNQMLPTIVESSAAELQPSVEHWGWYVVLASYRTEKDARSAASRAVTLEGLGGDIIGVYLSQNNFYALTLGGELSDHNEAQGKVEKAKQAFDGAYVRHGKNWKTVAHVGGRDAAK